jgi:hypothetical protein
MMHRTAESASPDRPVRFLAIVIADSGKPLVEPVLGRGNRSRVDIEREPRIRVMQESSSYPQLRRGGRFSHGPKELTHYAAENGESERYMHCQVVKVSAGCFDHFSHDDPHVRDD